MQNYQIHTIETAPEMSKPLLELFIHAVGFVPNLAGAVANSPVLAKNAEGHDTKITGQPAPHRSCQSFQSASANPRDC
jgi:hypothetical protein